MSNRNKHLLCFGMGFSARALAARLTPKGWRVTGTKRSEKGAAMLRAAGIDALVFDATNGEGPALPSDTSHALISIPPDEHGDGVLRIYSERLSVLPNLQWIGYLSTIGIYGDHGGAWVDEATPATPLSMRSKRRLAAENAWQDFARSSRTCAQLFRLPGIYGPGRNALESLRSRRARRIDKPGQVFNRIHVNDIAATIDAAMHRPATEGIFNVTDDEPAPPQDVISFAAQLLGIQTPPLERFGEAEMTPMARSFYDENRRVRNDRIKQELGLRLIYPTYREGLRALLERFC